MLIIRERPEFALRILRRLPVNRNYSKDYASSSDDEKEKPRKQKKPKVVSAEKPTGVDGEESASTRLNRLLASMQTNDTNALVQKAATLNMARPGGAAKKRREESKEAASNKDIFEAAKRVATLLGGDGEEAKKQTESELLAKLLGHDANAKSESHPVPSKSTAAEDQAQDQSLSELIVGMKIDRSTQAKEPSRADYVRRTLAAKNQQRMPSDQRHSGSQQQHRQRSETQHMRSAQSYTGSVNLFGCQPIGIFNESAQLRTPDDMLATWAHLHRQHLKQQVTHPPANYFEKLALWTEQGKVWRFPIDNEQDMDEEATVDFSEHIFLEQHLEPWCPTKGPVRHFMELVCVGLSKNPYVSARDKKEHILWYRDYFNSKKDILRDLMSTEKMNQLNTDGGKLEA